MGFALAEEAARLGGEVILITGPTHLQAPSVVERHDVFTAQEMFDLALKKYKEVDIVIAAAAVSDFKPAQLSNQKIKKERGASSIDLEPTQDILAQMGKAKQKQFLVGFALETNNEMNNALKKLKSKNLDAVVLNSLNDEGAGFSGDTNKITYIDKNEKLTSFEMKPKSSVAKDIFSQILTQYA